MAEDVATSMSLAEEEAVLIMEEEAALTMKAVAAAAVWVSTWLEEENDLKIPSFYDGCHILAAT